MWLIRHDVSAYNILKDKKLKSQLYQEFIKQFELDPTTDKAKALALAVQEEFSLGIGDAETPLLDLEAKRAEEVGIALRRKYHKKAPHVIFVSPYKRTKLTLAGLMRGWPELRKIHVVEDERIREQEHGLSLIYNDWRVFHTLHPEQRLLFKCEGSYWYRYPQGESVPDVRARDRSWMTSVVRDFSEKRVMAVTHHLNILGVRAHLERWSAEEFIRVDSSDRPLNCGVTTYRGNSKVGKDGRFELEYYNRRFYKLK